MKNEPRRQSSRGPAAFTLAELLVVMGLIAILATITVVAVGAIANDARLSSGKNTVLAALETARSLALKNNELVLVAFRAKLTSEAANEQVIEAVTAIWTGETFPSGSLVIDRFAPIPDVPVRRLPEGVKVAAPLYLGVDENWVTSSHLPAIISSNEVSGVIIAVMYSPTGAIVAQNSRSGSNRIFVDFNDDVWQQQNGSALNQGVIAHDYCDLGNDDQGAQIEEFYCQIKEDDEPYVVMAPFLAVFDDDEAREILDPARWTLGGSVERIDDLTAYVNERADPIHFNRYTGVALK